SQLLLYQCPVHPPHLRSLPTRRSSDLRHVALPGTRRVEASSGTRAGEGPLRFLCVATITPRKGHVEMVEALAMASAAQPDAAWRDRKSTRLNSSHVKISYAVFCLKKKQ